VHGKPFQEPSAPEKLLWKRVNKIPKQDVHSGYAEGEAMGVREETISLPEWDVHSGYAEGEATGVREGRVSDNSFIE